MRVCQSKVRIQMSLAEVEPQNMKWKTENERRETVTRLPRIEIRKEMVNSERLWKDEHQEAESVLPVSSATMSHVDAVV